MRVGILALVVSCFVASTAIVGLLFVMSKDLQKTPGSFLRLFPPHPVLEGDTLRLGFNNYYIAGGTSTRIYLGNYSAPLHVLSLNYSLTDTSHIRLEVKDIMKDKFWSVRVKIDSPHFYLYDGAVPRIYRGSLDTWQAERLVYDSVYFREIVPLGPNSQVIRSLGKPIRENILGKLSSSLPHVRFTPDVLQKQVDGIFCTDGILHYNKDLSRLIFTHYYRNEFIVMDTSLNVLYRGHTIDTTNVAKIKVAEVDDLGSVTMAAPPQFVNVRSSTSGPWLFVNSALIARNENPKSAEQGIVVDVYNLLNGRYHFSFYVYHIRGEKVDHFRIFGDKMVTIHEYVIRVHDLVPGYWDPDDTQEVVSSP